FNKPVSLGAYVLHSYDPDGKWFIWQLRDDWQRTRLGQYGKPGPKYVAHPDPTLPAVIFNTQNDLFKSPDVRWALALLIDIKAVSLASYRGAATISAIGVPPTGTYPDYYHKKLEAWLRDF